MKFFKISHLTDFSADELIDWLRPSDKRNSIMAIATGLISSLFNVTSSGDVPFCQLQQLQWFSSSMVLPKITLVFPLAWRWRFVVHALWLRCKASVSAEPAGALQTLFFAWNAVQHIRTTRSKTKPWPSDTPTLILINEAHLNNPIFCIFSVMAGLIVGILFVLFSVCVIGWKWVKTKHTG